MKDPTTHRVLKWVDEDKFAEEQEALASDGLTLSSLKAMIATGLRAKNPPKALLGNLPKVAFEMLKWEYEREHVNDNLTLLTMPPTIPAYLSLVHKPANQWQVKDMEAADATPEFMFVRARGGSKSEDGAALAVKWAWQNTDPHLTVVWLAGSEDQLKQASKYFRDNPFVAQVKAEEVVLKNGNTIDLAPLTPKRSRSKRACAVILDEEREMKPDLVKDARGMLAGDKCHILHLTTLAIGTVEKPNPAYESFITLKPRNLVSIHPWQEVDFYSPAKLAQIKQDEKDMPKWWMDLEYRCIPTVPGGAVFENIDIVADENFVVPDLAIKAGCDYNGMPGNVLVATIITGTDIYVLDERVFESQDTQGLARYCDQHHYDLEQETGGYNEGYAKDVAAPGQDVTNEWKGERVNFARKKRIHVKQSLRNTVKDLQSIPWKDDGTVDIHKFHYVAAFLHAIHDYQWVGAVRN